MGRLKKIPAESEEKVLAFLKKQSQQMETALHEVLNTEVEVISDKPAMATLMDINEIINSVSAISKLTLNNVENGEVYVVADFSSAMILTGMMVLTPTDVINQNLGKKKLTPEDLEHFEEAVNIVVEKLNETLATSFSPEYNFEMVETTKAKLKAGSDKAGILPREDFIIISYMFQPEDFPEVHIHYLIPRSTGEKLFRCSLEPEIDWGERTIVVVYDTKARDREFIRKTLETENIGVADFDSMKELIRSILQEEVNVIIMEVRPNDWDSLMVSKKLRKSAKLMKIPIILTLQKPTSDMIYLAYKAGIRSFLVKPLNGKELLEKVQELCA